MKKLNFTKRDWINLDITQADIEMMEYAEEHKTLEGFVYNVDDETFITKVMPLFAAMTLCNVHAMRKRMPSAYVTDGNEIYLDEEAAETSPKLPITEEGFKYAVRYFLYTEDEDGQPLDPLSYKDLDLPKPRWAPTDDEVASFMTEEEAETHLKEGMVVGRLLSPAV